MLTHSSCPQTFSVSDLGMIQTTANCKASQGVTTHQLKAMCLWYNLSSAPSAVLSSQEKSEVHSPWWSLLIFQILTPLFYSTTLDKWNIFLKGRVALELLPAVSGEVWKEAYSGLEIGVSQRKIPPPSTCHKGRHDFAFRKRNRKKSANSLFVFQLYQYLFIISKWNNLLLLMVSLGKKLSSEKNKEEAYEENS